MGDNLLADTGRPEINLPSAVPAVMSDITLDVVLPGLVAAAALAVVTLVYYMLRYAGRRSGLARDLVQRAYRPSQLVAVLAALLVTFRITADGGWRAQVLHALLLAVIAASAWLLTAMVNVLSALALRQLQVEVHDLLAARRIRTRVKVAHRVTLAVVTVLAIGVMLVTFEQVRTVGVSLLASAGLVGIIAALAAQSMLSNLFAGLQVAFGDTLNLDDVVVVEGAWGRVEEITLRNVVVKIWDERRLVLPTSYFTTNPFENWTKSGRDLLGTVEIDLDWSVPVDDMRAELYRILESTELWDRRTWTLDVIDATGSLVRVWAVVSAADSSAQWALRCLVREKLVGWLQREHPTALPRVRTEFGGALLGESPPPWAQGGQWAQTGQPAPGPRPPGPTT